MSKRKSMIQLTSELFGPSGGAGGTAQPAQPQEPREDLLSMSPEKRALLRGYVAAVKPFVEQGIKTRDVTDDIARALFFKELVSLMDKWGIWFHGDGCFSLTSKRYEGQHYALDEDGDFRGDDGRNGSNLESRGDGFMAVLHPAPISAHNTMKIMAHRMAAIEAFLAEEGGAA